MDGVRLLRLPPSINRCMNKYTIIEDCSPYYIRFTHNGLNDIIDFCEERIPSTNFNNNEFIHHRLPMDDANQLLSMVPMHNSGELEFRNKRVSLFITTSTRYYLAHKDGIDHRASINYTVKILDNKCVTSWYSDEDLKDYQIDPVDGWSRHCIGFDPKKHTPLKSMIARPNECILFNTDIFHDFDNSQSDNIRVVLTLRLTDAGNIYFDDIKRILFGL